MQSKCELVFLFLLLLLVIVIVFFGGGGGWRRFPMFRKLKDLFGDRLVKKN